MSEGLVSVFGSERSGRSEASLVFWFFFVEKNRSPLSFKHCTPAWTFSISHTNTHYSISRRGFCAVSAKDGDLVEAGLLKRSDRSHAGRWLTVVDGRI